MKRNCEPEVVSIIGLCENANEAYKELSAKFEGKTVTDLGAVLSNITRLIFDDRRTTIDEHIVEYEKRWNFMRSTLNGDFDTDVKEFGEALKKLATCDRAKAELLLISLPPFYSNLVENLRSKTGYTYGDISRQVRLYVPARQKGGRPKTEEGTRDNPVVLKTEPKTDNGKRCTYCQSKGWRGLNHEEKECFTKKREEKKRKDKKTNKSKVQEEEEDSDDDIKISQIRVRSAGTTFHESMGLFMYDTGASHSTTNNRALLTDIKRVNLSVKGHDGQKTTCDTIGTMTLRHNGRNIHHEETLFHPSYSNLVSGQRLPPHTMIVDETTAEIKLKGKRGTLYKMIRDEDGGTWIKPDNEKTQGTNINNVEVAREIHERYGHISYDTLSTLPQFPKIPKELRPRCEPCEKGKATKPPARDQDKKGRKIRTKQPLERLHADLVGPITPVTPRTQYKYLLVVVDDYSRYTVTKAIKTKDTARNALMEIIMALETATSRKVKGIQADWGGEFRNNELEAELRQRGTIMKETVPHHSETNAVVERANRTIFTMNRTILAAAKMPKGLWDYASAWSAYTKNRVPHKSIGTSPIKRMFPETDIEAQRSNLRKFGEKVVCYDYAPKDKLSARSYAGRIIGYTHTHEVYRVLDKGGAGRVTKNPKGIQEEDDTEETIGEERAEEEEPTKTGPPEELQAEEASEPPAAPKKKRTGKDWEKIVAKREPSSRIRQPTWKIQPVGTDADHPTDQQARESPEREKWAEARRKEREQLEKYGVFTRISKEDIPEGTKIVDTKWVYVVKRKKDGSIEKYKARKVGRGFTQVHGINYDDTYSQMMRAETFKILIVLALHHDWDIRQWDVVAAYLQADLKHQIYVSDINEKGEVEYWLLHKALYGLKQAGHEWYLKLVETLRKAGYEQCIGDEGCFQKKSKAVMGTHVDDLMGIGPKKELDKAEAKIEEVVELDKRGRPGKMLGMELTWKDGGVLLTQTGLIELPAKSHIHAKDGLKQTLLLDSSYYTRDEEDEAVEAKIFQSLVGSLLFISRMTRPDVAIHVNLLGRRCANLGRKNMIAALRVLSYLKATSTEGIMLRKPEGDLEVKILADAAYGGE